MTGSPPEALTAMSFLGSRISPADMVNGCCMLEAAFEGCKDIVVAIVVRKISCRNNEESCKM